MSVTKTVQTDLLAFQDLNTGGEVLGTEFNAANYSTASFGVRLGRRTGSAFTAGWPNIRIDANPASSGGSWIPIYTFQPVLGGTIANTTLNGAVSANAANFVVASSTNISAGDILYLGDSSFNTNTTTYELVRVKSVTASTVTTEDPVVNAHPSGAIVTDQAEMQYPTINILAYRRIRAVFDNANSGQACSAQVTLLTVDG